MAASRKRAAASAALDDAAAPAVTNRLQLIPAEVAQNILEFCRYDGHHTALDFAHTMKELGTPGLEEEELLRGMPQYIKQRGQRLKTALRDELAEVGGEAERVRGRRLRPAERTALLEQLEQVRPSLCRFCFQPKKFGGAVDRYSVEPLYRGLRRHLGAYSAAKNHDGFSHEECIVQRARRIRHDRTGQLEWKPVVARDESDFVRIVVAEDDRIQTADGPFAPKIVLVRATALQRELARLQQAQHFWCAQLAPMLQTELGILEKEVAASGLATAAGADISQVIASLAAQSVNTEEIGQLMPDLKITALHQMIVAARTYSLLDKARAEGVALTMASSQHPGYSDLVRITEKPMTPEVVHSALLKTARRWANSPWSAKYSAAKKSAGLNLINSACFLARMHDLMPEDEIIRLADRLSYD